MPCKNDSKDFELLINDLPVSDSDILCKNFNDHFTAVAPSLRSTIPHVDFNPMSYVKTVNNTFAWYDVNNVEVLNTINSFKSKMSPLDNIPNFMYKHVSNFISPVIAILINKSVREGVFPTIFKVARVIPLFKAGDRRCIVNYRPISLLHFLSKIIERLVHTRISKFLNKYNILYEDQYGFIKNKCTTDAILKFTDNCYSCFNNKNFLLSVFLDFSKAFDTIDQDILIRKLEYCGFRGFMLDWLKSYIFNRRQYVEINGHRSTTTTLNYGTGQGTILGPTLFLLYINDMHNCSNLNFIHFADDSSVFSSGDSIDSLCHNMNIELAKIDTWLCANKLSLNVAKSAYSIFSNRDFTSHPNICIRNANIKFVKGFYF